MKRCPKCKTYQAREAVKCGKCLYVFKGKTKKQDTTPKPQNEEGDHKWPSDEWKDWNTM